MLWNQKCAMFVSLYSGHCSDEDVPISIPQLCHSRNLHARSGDVTLNGYRLWRLLVVFRLSFEQAILLHGYVEAEDRKQE